MHSHTVFQEVKLMFPGAQRMNRGNHEITALVRACQANNVTDLVIVHETRGQPGMPACVSIFFLFMNLWHWTDLWHFCFVTLTWLIRLFRSVHPHCMSNVFSLFKQNASFKSKLHLLKEDCTVFCFWWCSCVCTDGLVVCHLPFGPTAYFTLYNVVMRHDVPDIGTMSEAYPHLIFHNFTSRLGKRVSPQELKRVLHTG